MFRTLFSLLITFIVVIGLAATSMAAQPDYKYPGMTRSSESGGTATSNVGETKKLTKYLWPTMMDSVERPYLGNLIAFGNSAEFGHAVVPALGNLPKLQAGAAFGNKRVQTQIYALGWLNADIEAYLWFADSDPETGMRWFSDRWILYKDDLNLSPEYFRLSEVDKAITFKQVSRITSAYKAHRKDIETLVTKIGGKYGMFLYDLAFVHYYAEYSAFQGIARNANCKMPNFTQIVVQPNLTADMNLAVTKMLDSRNTTVDPIEYTAFLKQYSKEVKKYLGALE